MSTVRLATGTVRSILKIDNIVRIQTTYFSSMKKITKTNTFNFFYEYMFLQYNYIPNNKKKPGNILLNDMNFINCGDIA